ncbi:MAG: DUF4405 domain-containing protein [Rhodobacteraceae bacterium]|nr:DUF4405 domain-containing protein [Paracoccaceae bacterium]
MSAFLNRYATPFITGLFLVSMISGIALFFHLGQSWFHGMHEWLSMVLIVPFVLHLWKNGRPVIAYLKRAPLWIALAVSAAMAALFVLPVGGEQAAVGGRPPQFAFAERMMGATVGEIAAVLDRTPEQVQAGLAAAGIDATGDGDLSAMTARAGSTSAQAMAALLALPD